MSLRPNPRDIPWEDWQWLKKHGLDHLKPDRFGWVTVGPGVQVRILSQGISIMGHKQ